MYYDLIRELTYQKFMDKPAFVFEGETYLYWQLLFRTEKVARAIDKRIPAGSKVCLLSPNLPDAFFIQLGMAASHSGILCLDPFASAAEIGELVRQYGFEYILFHESGRPKITEALGGRIKATKFPAAKEAFYLVNTVKPNRSPTGLNLLKRWFGAEKRTVPGNDTPYMYFSSSGSSGKPKVFPLTREQFYYQIIYVRDNFGFRKDDATLCTLHHAHSHSVCLMYSALAAGGTVHLMRETQALAPNIIEYIARNGITVFSNVPMIYKAFVDLAGHLDTSGLRTLRMALCGSAPLSTQVAVQFHEKYGQYMNQSYGLSEIGPVCINKPDSGHYEFGSIGPIFPEIEYRIIDDEGRDVPPGTEGHLVMRSKGQTDGYLDNPEANALYFRDGWLHTQDIVRENEHRCLFVIGRKSNFINVGGFKVFPAEIERVIMNMPQVKEVAVISADDETFGQVVRAFVVPYEGQRIDGAAVREFCARHLSQFKVPRSISVVAELPKNAIGKIVGSKLKP